MYDVGIIYPDSKFDIKVFNDKYAKQLKPLIEESKSILMYYDGDDWSKQLNNWFANMYEMKGLDMLNYVTIVSIDDYSDVLAHNTKQIKTDNIPYYIATNCNSLVSDLGYF